VRNVGADDFLDIGLRNAIERALSEGPAMLAAGHAIGSTGGHCDNSPFHPIESNRAAPSKAFATAPTSAARPVRYH